MTKKHEVYFFNKKLTLSLNEKILHEINHTRFNQTLFRFLDSEGIKEYSSFTVMFIFIFCRHFFFVKKVFRSLSITMVFVKNWAQKVPYLKINLKH